MLKGSGGDLPAAGGSTPAESKNVSACSNNSTKATATQLSDGIICNEGPSRSWKRTQRPKKISKRQRLLNEHKDSTVAAAGSPSEKVDTQEVVMNQVPPPSQEDVGPVRIAADGVDHHQIQEVEQRATPPSSNEEQTNFPNVISQ